jgi:hypothetical protein
VPEPDGIGRRFDSYQAIMDERDAPVRRNRLRLLGPEQGLIHKPLHPSNKGINILDSAGGAHLLTAPLRLAPCVPHWVIIQREADMHIDGQFINCVSFIGKQTEVGFYAEGTCFFLQVVEEEHMLFTYAVTASHIIRNLTGDVISIRVQRRPDLPPKIFNTSKSEWHNHPDPDIDICAYTIDWRIWNTDNDLNILALTQGVILTPEKQKLLGFGVGSDVFIPSAFVAALGERQNIPVVRFGHVAAMALEPIAVASPKRPAFLIETRSLGGMSGSPVMFHTDPARSGQRETLQTDDAGFLITPYLFGWDSIRSVERSISDRFCYDR